MVDRFFALYLAITRNASFYGEGLSRTRTTSAEAAALRGTKKAETMARWTAGEAFCQVRLYRHLICINGLEWALFRSVTWMPDRVCYVFLWVGRLAHVGRHHHYHLAGNFTIRPFRYDFDDCLRPCALFPHLAETESESAGLYVECGRLCDQTRGSARYLYPYYQTINVLPRFRSPSSL